LGMIEVHKQVIELDIPRKVFIQLLSFIYCGEPEDFEWFGDEPELVVTLLLAAKRFLVDSLESYCCEVMMQFISLDNAVDLLLLSKDLSIDYLWHKTVGYICKRYENIQHKEEWQKLDKGIRDLVLKDLNKTKDLYQKPPTAPWVEVYLNTPHSTALKPGETISLQQLQALGFNASQWTIFKNKPKQKENSTFHNTI